MLMVIALVSSAGAYALTASTTLTLKFSGAQTYINPLVVTDDNGTHTLAINSEAFTTIEGSVSEWDDDEEGEWKFTIDANNGGKFAYNSQPSAQVNAGTQISFSVEGDASISIKDTYQNGTTTIELFAGGVVVDSKDMTANGVYELSYKAPIVALWDFQHGVPTGISDTNIQGKTDYVASTLAGFNLSVDATSGKLAGRESDAQFNQSTIIKVPVYTTEDIVEVVSYPNYHYYTVGGSAADADLVTYTATSDDVKQGYAEIVATATSYLYSISAQYSPADFTTIKVEFTSGNNYFDKIELSEGGIDHKFIFTDNSLYSTSPIQGTTQSWPSATEGDTYTATADATNGKFRFSDADNGAQINAGSAMIFENVRGNATVKVSLHYLGGAGSLTFFVNDVAVETVACEAIGVYEFNHKLKEVEVYTPSTWDGKLEVWDFGQAVIEGAHNMLTADVINAWYKQEDGTYISADGAKSFADDAALNAGVADAKNWTLPSFESGDLSYFNNNATNHRLRTTKENVIRYDNSSYTVNGEVMEGYIYSNSGSQPNVKLYLDNCKQGDRIDYILGNNGNNSNVEFSNGSEVIATCTVVKKGELHTFYVPADGKYSICSTNEKLTVARVTRTHAGNSRISGKVTPLASDGTNMPESSVATVFEDCKLVFSNKEIGFSKEVEIAADGTYEALNIPSGVTYSVTSSNSNYITVEGTSVEVPLMQDGNVDVVLTDKNVSLQAISKVSITGTIVGLPDPSKLTIVVSSSEIFVPEFAITGSDYSVELQKDTEYTLAAEGVNDYELKTTSFAYSENTDDVTITFEKKPVYDITINPTVATTDDLETATFTFTRLDDKYVYTFTGTSGIQLRDGSYSVKVTNTGAFAQLLTSNLVVNGAATTKTIDFETGCTEWVFSSPDFTNPLSYKGLTTTNGQINKIYLLAGSGTISIPAKKGDLITIKGCYQMKFQFESEEIIDTKSGSTGTIESYTYIYNGEASTATINVSGTTYFTSISAVTPESYVATIYVGATREYTTVTEAMAAIRKMNRPTGESGRVTIMIDPGNYEEMPVIDADYITLKNAASDPSIALNNKGVDIDENAVRITSYYGEGYSYFSCGADNKWNERVLAVSKENGINTYACEGGSTNESYWNATVVVKGSNFIAEDIIFENSFNQYISAKEADDVLINEKGDNPSATKVENGLIRPKTLYSTEVQDKKYVERAAAIAIIGDRAVLNHCAVVGRQDSFYGHVKVRVACYKCELYGATDYIFGSQDMIVYDSKLVMNTSDDKNDQAYLIALKAPSYKGSLFMNCTVTSTTPGINTASKYKSKPGNFGRPWETTENATFANTTIETSNHPDYEGASLILKNAWNSSLSGQSEFSYEYGNNYNGAVRCEGGNYNSKFLTDAEAANITLFTYTKGTDNWDPFRDMFEINSDLTALDNAIEIVTGIESLAADKEVAGVEYYSVGGQKIQTPKRGISIKVTRYNDGSYTTSKVLVK